MQYWGWFWSYLSYFSLHISCNFNTESSKEIITLYVPFCTLVNTTWYFCLHEHSTFEPQLTPQQGLDGADQAILDRKTGNLQNEKHFDPACFNAPLLRSADWSKGNLPSWIQTQKIPGESWARSRPLHLGSLSSVNVYLLFWNYKLPWKPVFCIFIWSMLILYF